MRELKTAWGRISQAQFAIESKESSPQFVQIVTPEEIVIVVTMEIIMGDVTGIASFCYPFRSLEFVADRLSARYYVAEEQRAAAEKSKRLMQDVVGHVPITLSVSLGEATIRLNDLLRMKEGDVLLLERLLGEPLDMEAGGQARCRGFLGAHREKRALSVSERVREE
jgi:flagellar motor switch protein FliM